MIWIGAVLLIASLFLEFFVAVFLPLNNMQDYERSGKLLLVSVIGAYIGTFLLLACLL
jgi:hypothetical protein